MNTDFADSLRELILNARKPLVLRNFKTNWNCFECTLKEWCQKYDAATTTQPTTFERMPQLRTATPQWERQRESLQMTATQFFEEHSTDRNYWTGLNYKRAHEWPNECIMGVDFSNFGFPHTADDCSYWLSSKGANTPCHYDTYGCNIVVQVYGSTRIPYEESSVYCTENFYAPSPKQLKDFEKIQNFAHQCILGPNDALIVPRHWWHYVEALDNSLSVNFWIPLEADKESQVDECIVKYVMENFVKKDSHSDVLKYVLNPNQLQQLADETDILDILKYLLETRDSATEPESKKLKGAQFPYQYLAEDRVEQLLKEMPEVGEIPLMSTSAFRTVLVENAQRFDSKYLDSDLTPLKAIRETLINSICSPNVVDYIKKEFYKRHITEDSILNNL